MNSILLFKISSCSECKKQEQLFRKNNLEFISCEMFKNRQLAMKYEVTDVPTTVIIDENLNKIKKYEYLLNEKKIEEIRNFL